MQFLTLFALTIVAAAAVVTAAPTEQGQNQPGQPGWQPEKPDCDCDDHDGSDHNQDHDHDHDHGDHDHDGDHDGHDGDDHGHDDDDCDNDGGDDAKWGEKVRVGYTLDLNPNTRLSSLSCSNVFAQKFPQFADKTLGELPTAPFYGEIPGATGGSPKCGSCWKVKYDDKDPIYMIAVDNAAMFQLGKQGFEKFAGQQGFNKGSVEAKAMEVSPEYCHLPPPKKW